MGKLTINGHFQQLCQITRGYPIWSPWNESVLHRDTQLIGLSPCVSRCRRRWNRHSANGFWTVEVAAPPNGPEIIHRVICISSVYIHTYIYIYKNVEIRYLIIAAYVIYIYIYISYIYISSILINICIYIHRYFIVPVYHFCSISSPCSARLRLSCRDWNWPCCRRDSAWKWRIRADGLWLGGVLHGFGLYISMISKINLVTVYYIYTIYMSRIYVCVYINICNYCARMYNIYIHM
jgi:hypothetical protein